MRKNYPPSFDKYETLILVLAWPIVVSQLAWICHAPFFPLLALSGAAVIGWLIWRHARYKRTARPKVGLLHFGLPVLIGILLIALASAAPFTGALLRHPHGSDLISLQMYGFDDQAHFNLVKDIAVHDALRYPSLTLHPTPAAYSLATYPQGWHAISSVAYILLLKACNLFHLAYPVNEVAAYTIVKVLWYALLSIVSYALILELVRLFRGAFTSAKEYAFASSVAVALTVLLQLVLLLSITLAGFESFIGDLVFIGLAFILAIRALQQNHPSFRTFVLLLLCALGASSTWFINLLILLVVIYVLFIQTRTDSFISSCRYYMAQAFSRRYLKRTAGVSLLMICILVPPFVTFVFGAGSDLNTPGGITPINVSLLAWLTSAALLGLALLRPAIDFGLRIWTLLISPVIVWGLVEVYQLASTGSLSYYYHKTGETVLYCIFILFAATLIAHLLNARDRLGRRFSPMFLPVSLTLLLLTTLLPINFGLVREYAGGNAAINKFTSEQSRQDLLQILHAENTPNVVAFFGDPTQDQTLNNFLTALSTADNPYQRLFAGLNSQTQTTNFAQALGGFVQTNQTHSARVIGTATSLASLRQMIPAAQRVRIVFVTFQ